ncbi:MAG: hypothetical protein LUC27_00485, partial [Lachnospiraceae bacterium]|nr:hypothetical protein [Lachnospiraceae bacterium]
MRERKCRRRDAGKNPGAEGDEKLPDGIKEAPDRGLKREREVYEQWRWKTGIMTEVTTAGMTIWS